MSYLEIKKQSRTGSMIAIAVNWYPDVNGWYKVEMYWDQGYAGQSGFGNVQLTGGGGPYTEIFYFSGLTTNTQYHFTPYIFYYDVNVGDYIQGSTSGSGSTTSLLTYPAAPINVTAHQDNRYIRVGWNQPMGGSQDSIDYVIELQNANTGVVTATYSNSTSSYSNAAAIPITSSTTIQGRYIVSIYVNNAATRNDYKTRVIYTSSNQFDVKWLAKWSWSNEQGSWNHDYSWSNSQYNNYANILWDSAQALNGGRTSNFSHIIWNDIIAWLVYNLNQTGATVDQNTVTDAQMNSDTVLTANRYNNMVTLWRQLKSQIGTTLNETLAYVYTGDRVQGSLFTNLVDWMNTFIDSY